MRNVTFSSLYLLSSKEGSALSVSFNSGMNVLVGANQAGKSVVMKSLYETFGAKPHKVDDTWRAARASSLVTFRVDGSPYSALKVGGVYAIFDGHNRKLIQTTQVVKELGPFLADLFDFRLVMLDKAERTVVPHPSYIFAPFYVDQDRSWSDPWKSFADLFLPKSAQRLSEYYAGIRPNEYYVAQVERDKCRSKSAEIGSRREALSSTLAELRSLAADNTLVTYDLAVFSTETEQLIARTNQLSVAEDRHRSRLASLNEELQLWTENLNVLKAATAEIDSSLGTALTLPHDVECPTCGHIYRNSIVEQFGLVSEKDGLIQSMLVSTEHIRATNIALELARKDLTEVAAAIGETNAILSVQRSGISFEDIVAAQGRAQASDFLKEKVDEIDMQLGELGQRISALEKAMKDASDTRRSIEIRSTFYDALEKYLLRLDVSRQSTTSRNLYTIKLARGSEGPRGLAAYYVAFLDLIYRYGRAVACPMVIDAPNQQGQDREHMRQILSFLLKNRPGNAQFIVAVEETYGIDLDDATIINVGTARKRRVMSEEVNDIMSPFLASVTA